MNKGMKKAGYLLIWLLIWQILAMLIHNPIYFASPAEVILALFEKIRDPLFWRSVASSLLRILFGFFAAFLLGFLCAFASHFKEWFRDFLSPMVHFLKSVPVAAVVVILLIWWGSKYLVLFICLMVVFPNIYLNMQAGLLKADENLLEVAKVFRFRRRDTFLWIYRPAYTPHLHAALSVSLGMCFKSGIAAEVIGLPEFSIGEQLYRDKIYFHTAGVFAWIIVVLTLSMLTEKILLFLFHRLSAYPAAILPSSKISDLQDPNDHQRYMPSSSEQYTVRSEGNISKSYNDRIMIDTDLNLKRGSVYYLNAPSGAGKTTLLHMIAGLTTPDEGRIHTGKISMVFQEDRLIENANAFRNLKIAGCRGSLEQELETILPKEVLSQPVCECSGGERRRIVLARALLAPSDIVIADEPFTGLDEETKKKAAAFILSHLNGRTLLFTTHETESILSAANAEELHLLKGS